MSKRRLLLNENQLDITSTGSSNQENIVFNFVRGELVTSDFINYTELSTALNSINELDSNDIIKAEDLGITAENQPLTFDGTVKGIFNDPVYKASQINVYGRNYTLSDYSPVADYLTVKFNYEGYVILSFTGNIVSLLPEAGSGNNIGIMFSNEGVGGDLDERIITLNSVLRSIQTAEGNSAVNNLFIVVKFYLYDFYESPENIFRFLVETTLTTNSSVSTTPATVSYNFLNNINTFAGRTNPINPPYKFNFKIIDQPNSFTSKTIRSAKLLRGKEIVLPKYL